MLPTLSTSAQIADAPDASIAQIPVNYTEAKVGTFTLPDVLKTLDGKPVTDAKTWIEQRRPELLKFYQTQIYGRIPATAPKVTWQVVSTDRSALNAPRPLLLQTGNTDRWSDPKGEFVAAIVATDVYKLLGKLGLDKDQSLETAQLLGHDRAYYMHDGGHGVVPSDWDVYLKFMETWLKP